MNDQMFCRQCQEAANNVGCTIGGRCGKNAEIANLMDTLVAELQAIALTLENRPAVTREFSRFICRAMFATITNTNFNPARIQSLIDEARRALRTLDSQVSVPPAGVRSNDNEDIRSLRELILYGIKGISAYACHALALGNEDIGVYNFIIRALAAIARDDVSADKLRSLVHDCGIAAMSMMATLDAANTEAYGSPRLTRVPTSVGNRPGILVSGHDYKDLEELLEQTKDRGIDIYTHGEMLPAHAYPKFKQYPHLRGNYGSAWYRQGEEFESFNGAILMTTNCLVPVRNSYRDRLFTTGMAGYPDIPHILHRHVGGKKDFSPVIECAKKCQPPRSIGNGELLEGFAHDQVFAVIDKVVELVKSGVIKRFIVMAGCDGRQKEREYFTEVAKLLPKEAVILTAGCAKYRYNSLDLGEISGFPRVLDAGQCNDSYSLIRIAFRMQDIVKAKSVNDLPISFDLAWYEQKAVAVLLALLSLGFKNIRLGPTLPAFLSPNVAALLVREFGIKPCSTPAEDVAAMMQGK